jgi:hypothetical protein
MAAMLMRLIIVLCASIQLAAACDCIRLPVKDARRGAEIVFQGTIVAMHESDQHFPVATFKVVRVWKGNLNETFEMPAIQEGMSCLGFTHKVEIGAEFLVYARKIVPSDTLYFPLPCQTDLVSRAADQIRALGRARKPATSK